MPAEVAILLEDLCNVQKIHMQVLVLFIHTGGEEVEVLGSVSLLVGLESRLMGGSRESLLEKHDLIVVWIVLLVGLWAGIKGSI
jgi:hypothetical protein